MDGSTQIAMRSWDSEMASSVPSSPSYFLGMSSSLMSSDGAISPMATETPPAPKSLQTLIFGASSGLRKRRWTLRSVGAFPFWTSAELSSAVSVCSLDEPVAPPTPSRPVRPPMRRMTSPVAGLPRKTFFLGAAATTAPISMRLAT